MNRRLLRFSIVLGLFLFVSSLRAADHVIIVTDDPDQVFFHDDITIQVGDTITWQNIAGTHNVVADDASFTSGAPTAAPWTFTRAFQTVGPISYHCALHEDDGQVGRIYVRQARAANEVAVTINAWDMQRTAAPLSEGGFTTFTRRDGTFQSSVRLPSGVQITGLELSACDSNLEPGGTNVSLVYCPEPNGGCQGIASVTSIAQAGSDFCRVFGTDVAEGTIVDNLNNTYALRVMTFGGDGFRSVKVFYEKVLSPAPATATFGDVSPGHIAFRAIEALAASGITQGCGAGQFCPSQTLTRAEMAIFLARAFGLFWAN